MKKIITFVVAALLIPSILFAVDMSPRNYGRDANLYYSASIADGENGEAVRVTLSPGGRLSCTIVAGANSGKIQYTTSLDTAVSAGTATWQDWPKGTVTGTASDSLIAPVSAVRGVSVSGAITVEFVQ